MYRFIKNNFKGMIFLILLMTAGLWASNQAETEAYKKAYTMILEEKWESAIKSFAEFTKLYKDSKYIDDARFWSCYALSKTGNNLENAVACYEDFIHDFDESNWSDDARANLIKLARKLEKMGNPEYGELIQEMEGDDDEDVAIAAIFALQNMDTDASTEALLNLYDKKKSPEIREKIIFALAESNSPKAKQKIFEVAKSDPDSKLRKRAIFWIGEENNDNATLQFLADIARNDKDVDVREQAVFALAEMSGAKGLPALMALAKEEQDPRIRKKALFWIGEEGDGKEIRQFLLEFALNEKDPEMAEQAIFGLSEMKDGQGLPALVEVIKSNAPVSVRKKAVFWIGDNAKTKEQIDFLLEIALDENENEEIREHAVFGIAKASRGIGKEALKKVALSNINGQVRKKAIFWIGEEAKTEKDIQFLKSILDKDHDPEVMEQAVFSIAEAPDWLGIPALIQTAKNHNSYRIRKKAVFWLGESNDPRAKDALLEIVNAME